MYRFSANSRATISSTAIFLSQQSRQYFSSPRGSETSLAPHSAHRDLVTDDLRDMTSIYNLSQPMSKLSWESSKVGELNSRTLELANYSLAFLSYTPTSSPCATILPSMALSRSSLVIPSLATSGVFSANRWKV